MGDAVRLPGIGEGKPSKKMSREEFKRWVNELGRAKIYPDTPFVFNSDGVKRTLKEELQYYREDVARLAAEAQGERKTSLENVLKMSDSELLQGIRQRSEQSDGIYFGDDRDTTTKRNRLIAGAPMV